MINKFISDVTLFYTYVLDYISHCILNVNKVNTYFCVYQICYIWENKLNMNANCKHKRKFNLKNIQKYFFLLFVCK